MEPATPSHDEHFGGDVGADIGRRDQLRRRRFGRPGEKLRMMSAVSAGRDGSCRTWLRTATLSYSPKMISGSSGSGHGVTVSITPRTHLRFIR
jgi:hypothetical protein